jgi:putative oxidoreductase
MAWCTAFFECAVTLCFPTGGYFSEAALLAVAHVLFLGFAVHGPAGWRG